MNKVESHYHEFEVVCIRVHVLFIIYVICVWLSIAVYSTYCVVFLFCLSSPYVRYVASVSGLSILGCPFGFSNFYLPLII
jgi:hypothetical protein